VVAAEDVEVTRGVGADAGAGCLDCGYDAHDTSRPVGNEGQICGDIARMDLAVVSLECSNTLDAMRRFPDQVRVAGQGLLWVEHRNTGSVRGDDFGCATHRRMTYCERQVAEGAEDIHADLTLTFSWLSQVTVRNEVTRLTQRHEVIMG
jgi:hypothetical protein